MQACSPYTATGPIKIRSRSLGLILVLTALFAGAAGVVAQPAEDKILEIAPPVVEVAVAPGQTHRETLTLKNLSTRTLSLILLIRDFVAGGTSGEPTILPEGERSKYSLASWMRVDQTRLTLEPGQERVVTVTISVPSDAEPGGHYGLVAYTEEATQAGQQPGGVAVRPGVGTLFLVKVAGEVREEGVVEQFGPTKSLWTIDRVDFRLRFKNTGNIHTKPTGRISITNMFGREVGNLAVNQSGANVLPESSREFTASWQPSFALGRYRAQLILKVGDRPDLTTSEPVPFLVLPLRQLAIGALVILILILVVLEYNAMIAARAKRHV